MSRPLYETAEDLSREAGVAEVLCRVAGQRLVKLPISYGVDFCVLDKSDAVVGWAEVKNRTGMSWGQYPDIMLSVLKARAAKALHLTTGLRTALIVADSHSEIRYVFLDSLRPQWIRHGGRTKNTRDSADIETCYYIPEPEFVPISSEEIPWDQ